MLTFPLHYQIFMLLLYGRIVMGIRGIFHLLRMDKSWHLFCFEKKKGKEMQGTKWRENYKCEVSNKDYIIEWQKVSTVSEKEKKVGLITKGYFTLTIINHRYPCC